MANTMMDMARLEALEEKLEREGLTDNEKAEIALINSKILREAK